MATVTYPAITIASLSVSTMDPNAPALNTTDPLDLGNARTVRIALATSVLTAHDSLRPGALPLYLNATLDTCEDIASPVWRSVGSIDLASPGGTFLVGRYVRVRTRTNARAASFAVAGTSDAIGVS